jgi:hypothetical protein
MLPRNWCTLPNIHEKAADIWVALETLRMFLRTAEADARLDQFGVMRPAWDPLDAARHSYPKTYPGTYGGCRLPDQRSYRVDGACAALLGLKPARTLKGGGALEKARPFPNTTRETVLSLPYSAFHATERLRASSPLFYLIPPWLLPMTWTCSLEEPLRGYFNRLVVRYTIAHLAVEKSY